MKMKKPAIAEYRMLLELLKQQKMALQANDHRRLDRIHRKLKKSRNLIEGFTGNFELLDPQERRELKRILADLNDQLEANERSWSSILKVNISHRIQLRSARRFYQELGKAGTSRNPRYSQSA